MSRPLLLGMNNPLSDDPYYDLFPYPRGSAGYRLWKMLPEGMTRPQYMDTFERLNLLRMREWSNQAVRKAADDLRPQLVGRFVIVLGRDVRAALEFEQAEPLSVNTENVFTENGGGVVVGWPSPTRPGAIDGSTIQTITRRPAVC